ncbi:hypothetical protein, conserved [Babesia bigemina]|uniref:Uncharacterized protein n=1 Tax=Babesia bigemina TaxID=5866 RepID=A0A061D6Y7_BABBI|nr:hypothetical protein, conserved [Babesia bigemina]CDR96471.1 hypothetical protein, conserved [Babesia bigemina]|eukprot:XP_012768657.1 hypothetical protein, conserved [Babesia bigemina]
MRGSHAVNLRRVLSLPTARRETFLFGRARARPRATRSGLAKPIRREGAPGTVITPSSLGNGVSNDTDYDTQSAWYGAPAPTGGRAALVPQSPQSADGKVSDSIAGRINASFDRSDIAYSASNLMEGRQSPLSVEAVLDLQIRQNVFNLPAPRLRVWLYNLDIGTIAQAALSNLFSATPSVDKVLVAESVLANKVGSEHGVRSCRDAFLLLKLQRALLLLGLRCELNLALYRPCIQLLNFKLDSMRSEHVVHVCQTLAWLWHRMALDGKLESIRDCHGLKEADDLQASLYSPLVSCLERAVLDIGPDTITRLLDLLVMLQRQLSKGKLMSSERVESNLPKPFYFVCKEVLAKLSKSVDYKDFHLVVRCLSRCSSVDPVSLNCVLLLYKSLATGSESSMYYPLERFVVEVILRGLEIEPVTKDANAELRRTQTEAASTYQAALTPLPSCYITVPKGYRRKVHSLKDISPLISWAVGTLKRSMDPSVADMCDYSHIKRHYRMRSSLQLPLTDLLRSSADRNNSAPATPS